MEGRREKRKGMRDRQMGGQRERREREVHSDDSMHENKSQMRMDGSKETRMVRTV